jgi:hypothetical protein
VRSTKRCAETRIPIPRPANNISIRLLVSSLAPAAAPPPSHLRRRSRSSAVLTHSRTTAQAGNSGTVVLPRCAAARRTGARRGQGGEHPAEPARPEHGPPAGAGMTRTAVGLTPVMPVIRVSNGMSGGWST